MKILAASFKWRWSSFEITAPSVTPNAILGGATVDTVIEKFQAGAPGEVGGAGNQDSGWCWEDPLRSSWSTAGPGLAGMQIFPVPYGPSWRRTFVIFLWDSVQSHRKPEDLELTRGCL